MGLEPLFWALNFHPPEDLLAYLIQELRELPFGRDFFLGMISKKL